MDREHHGNKAIRLYGFMSKMWSGWVSWTLGDTPKTVMTTGAPALLKRECLPNSNSSLSDT